MKGEIFFGPGLKIGVGRGLLVLGVGLAGACPIACGGDEAPHASSPGATGGAPGAGGSTPGPGGSATGPDAQVPPACPNPRVLDGELQNRASGPSVFGIVVGGDAGTFDLLGGSECGLSGVRICQRGTGTCTDSDAAGQFVLGGLPQGQDIEITFENPGSSSVIRLVHAGSSPINLTQTRLLDLDYAKALLENVGTVLDLTNKGTLVAAPIAAGDGIGGFIVPEGVVVTLVPSGPAPLYSRGSESPGGLSSDEFDASLQATRTSGWAIFANVEPGDYAVHFERNGQPCTAPIPGFGYGADADGNIRAKILAGYSTASISAFCP